MSDSIRIIEVAHALPSGQISAQELAQKFDLEMDFVSEKLGIKSLPRLDKITAHSARDLCLECVSNLKTDWLQSSDIDCLVVCTQNPDGNGIPHLSASLHGSLGLSHQCATWDVSLGCSGYVYSVWMVAAWMRQQKLKRALLFTCDLYSRTLDFEDKSTATLFGDAATVTCIESGTGEGFYLDDAVFCSDGSKAHVLTNADGFLQMNGREVFNFAIKKVPEQVEQLLTKNNLTKNDIDKWIFHQGSRFIVENLAKRLAIDQNQVPCTMGEFGNTVSSSIPLILESVLIDPAVKKAVISGFGIGLSWASGILTRQ